MGAPAKPLVPAGPTTVITVPPGSAGKTIQVPHPGVKGAFIAVNVPRNAKPGQAMLVPVPADAAVIAHGTPVKGDKKSSGGWSTGGKVAAGTAAVGAVAGVGAWQLVEHFSANTLLSMVWMPQWMQSAMASLMLVKPLGISRLTLARMWANLSWISFENRSLSISRGLLFCKGAEAGHE